MLTRTIKIDEKPTEFRASAAIPRLYRMCFRRDILMDIQKLKKAYIDNQTKDKQFEITDLEIFENVAYIMAKHADTSIKGIDNWLDEFNMFSIYQILPEIIELWALNEETIAKSKKNLVGMIAKGN